MLRILLIGNCLFTLTMITACAPTSEREYQFQQTTLQAVMDASRPSYYEPAETKCRFVDLNGDGRGTTYC